MFGNERERPLLQSKLGAFLDPDLGPFGVAAKGAETRDVAAEVDRIIAPVTGGDHPSVQVEDAREFLTVECGNRAPLSRTREGRDDAQARFALGSA